MGKEFRFFAFLLESYAEYKGSSVSAVLKKMDEKNITDFVYRMYDLYHTEAIENAYADIDSLIENGRPAW